ncbi:unnamed protein product [Aphanomyces euteiches]
MAEEVNEGNEQSADQFARAVSQIAVTHILAKGVGFDSVQPNATSALVDVMATYIQRIGRQAQELAEVAGRAKPRGTDVSLALKDMVPYAVSLDDMIKSFQESQHRYEGKLAFPREIGQRDTEKPAYAPSFAPPLPFKHSYSQQRRVVVEKEDDPKRIRLDLLNQKSEVQASLHNLADYAPIPTASIEPVWKPHVKDVPNPYVAPARVDKTDQLYAPPKPSYRPVVAKPTKRAIELSSNEMNQTDNSNNQK